MTQYAKSAEDRAIDAGEELKNIRMMDNETANEYIRDSKMYNRGAKCIGTAASVQCRPKVA